MGTWDKSYCLRDDSNKLPSFRKGEREFGVCFGCQKVYARDNGEHLKSCKRKAEHKALLKDILGGDEGVEVPEGDAPVSAAAEETIRQLRAKVALLEKQTVEQRKTIIALEENLAEKEEEKKELENDLERKDDLIFKANKLFYTAVGGKKPGTIGPSFDYSRMFLKQWQRAGVFRPLVELLPPPIEHEDDDPYARTDSESEDSS